jgi:hypothetical protein
MHSTIQKFVDNKVHKHPLHIWTSVNGPCNEFLTLHRKAHGVFTLCIFDVDGERRTMDLRKNTLHHLATVLSTNYFNDIVSLHRKKVVESKKASKLQRDRRELRTLMSGIVWGFVLGGVVVAMIYQLSRGA